MDGGDFEASSSSTVDRGEAWRTEQLRAQGEALLAREALGRSPGLERLFRFLLACSLEGRGPKELEIADKVFGKAHSDDGDASIRVHVHRLRRKLDDYYAGPGADEAVRVRIPKGGYRLTVEPVVGTLDRGESVPVVVDSLPTTSMPRRRPRLRYRELAAVLLLLVAVASLSWWIARRTSEVDGAIETVRSSVLWQPSTSNGHRVAIVVGDYYIFGDRDADGSITRLVREFSVNSPKDLERLVASGRAGTTNYVDLGLNYLPVGVANALRVVVPVLRGADGSKATALVVPASQMAPEMIKYTNLVYLGYLSGLGSLRDPVFSNSRYAVGGSYDEIIDRKTGRSYVAGTHLDREDEPSRDYALVSTFAGVGGNRIVVIAGTRDAALMQAAEFATRPESLAQMTAGMDEGTAFEALIAVESLHNVGLRGTLLSTSRRQGEPDWSGKHSQVFPDDLDQSPRPE